MPGAFRNTRDYLALPREPHTWLVKGVVPAGGSVNLFGKPKLGKSFAALQLAAALSSGDSDWLGFPILAPGPVAYFQIDTPRPLWVERVERLLLKGFSFDNVYWADAMDADEYPFNIMGSGFHWLKTELAGMANEEGNHVVPALVVIDTLRDIHAGDEAESSHIRNVVTQLRAAIGWKSAMLLVSHARKGHGFEGEGYVPDIRDENRGSGALAGAVDSILWLRDKRLTAVGRGLEEVDLAIRQDPDTLTLRLADSFTQDAIRLLADAPPLIPLRELARKLQERYPKKTYEACRSVLRRCAPTHARGE